MPTPRKRNNKLCIVCNLALATIFIKPDGRILKDGTGYCTDCHERGVRCTVDTGTKRESSPVVAIF